MDTIDLNSLKKIIKDIVHTITIKMPKVVLPKTPNKPHLYETC